MVKALEANPVMNNALRLSAENPMIKKNDVNLGLAIDLKKDGTRYL
jgi:pyruvate/2-oxoglutarate dehydrogenase complex dihydrolipoamide acyltransferase (E2) component